MRFIRLPFSRIANAPRMLAIIPNMAIAAMTNPSGQNAIESANRQSNRLFAAYIIVLIVTALSVALFTYLTWQAGNKVQDAVRVDALARISVSDQKAAEANQRSKELEASNLVLKGQVATLQTAAFDSQKDVAELQDTAAKQQERAAKAESNIALAEQHASEANAKSEGFRLDIARANEASAQAQARVAAASAEAAKATERAAEATKAAEAEKIERLKLEAQIAPRRITSDQAREVTKSCAHLRNVSVEITSYAMDAESTVLALQISRALQAAGMHVSNNISSMTVIGGFTTGIRVNGTNDFAATIVRLALKNEGGLTMEPSGRNQIPNPTGGMGSFRMGPPSEVTILVGIKPIDQ